MCGGWGSGAEVGGRLYSGSVLGNPPAYGGSRVQSRVQKDPLEKEMATHSNILAWRAPWTEEPGGLHSVHGVT